MSHYCSVKTLLEYYDITDVLKEPLDIDCDLSPLNRHIQNDIDLPKNISSKISSFRWVRGKSDWLITPNRKGSAFLNSYTKYCPKCLKNDGYYQLKWKLNLVNGCIKCGCELLSKCEQCKRPLSPLESERMSFNLFENNPLFICLYCKSDLRKVKTNLLPDYLLKDIEQIVLSYSEAPVNERYLIYRQTNEIVPLGRVCL